MVKRVGMFPIPLTSLIFALGVASAGVNALPHPLNTSDIGKYYIFARTDSGVLRGLLTANGRKYLGIPYAQPPLGDLRWGSCCVVLLLCRWYFLLYSHTIFFLNLLYIDPPCISLLFRSPDGVSLARCRLGQAWEMRWITLPIARKRKLNLFKITPRTVYISMCFLQLPLLVKRWRERVEKEEEKKTGKIGVCIYICGCASLSLSLCAWVRWLRLSVGEVREIIFFCLEHVSFMFFLHTHLTNWIDPLPVMIFIHGGAYESGGSSIPIYSGTLREGKQESKRCTENAFF